jgi:tetratricopeptide (TPR) repeat protein
MGFMKITFVILALLLATQSSQKKADSSATVSAGIQAKYEENRTAARKAAQAGDLDKAADLYQQNIDMGSNQKPQSQFEIGEASSDLARLRMGQHRLDDAATLFQKSIHAFETDPQPDKDRIALDAQSLGMVYLAKSEFTKAESMFQKSLKLHTEEREKLPWPDGKKQ